MTVGFSEVESLLFLYFFLSSSLDGFQCVVPEMQAKYMKAIKNERCKPMVICQVVDPYDSAGSVLENSQCIKVIVFFLHKYMFV